MMQETLAIDCEFTATTLGDIVTSGGGIIQTGPFGSQLHASDYVDQGVPVIMPANIKDNRVNLVGIARIKQEDANRLSKHIVKSGDIIYSRRGDVTKKALITKLEEGMFCGTGCLLVRPGNQINARFLHYHLGSPDNQEWIIRHAVGATMPNLNTGILNQIPLQVPDIFRQKAIAHILGSLDDKIELNRQINKTLEAMAQALFKSWFVDFDPVIDNALAAGNPIPDVFAERAKQRAAAKKPENQSTSATAVNDSSNYQHLFPAEFEFTEEMGWIPKGWEVRTLAEVTSVIIDNRGKTPKKFGAGVLDVGFPALSAKHIKNNKIVRQDAIEFVDQGTYEKWMKVPLEQEDVALTSEAPLGELYYFHSKKDYLLGQRLYGLRADKNICTGAFLFHWLQSNLGAMSLQSRATGTTVLGIKKSELLQVSVLCGSLPLIQVFDEYAKAYLSKMDANDYQSLDLERLRDTLLPKLLSGELRIPDAEKLVQEALL